MSPKCKQLKLMSLLLVVCAVVYAVFAVMGFTSGNIPGVETDNVSTYSIALIVFAVITLVSAVLGIRAANKPSTINPAFYMSYVAFIYEALILDLFLGDGFGVTEIAMFILASAMSVFTTEVRKENKDRL